MATIAARPLSLRRWERWEPLTGIIFGVLFFVGQNVLVLSAPGESASTRKIMSFYTDKGKYHEVVVGKLLVVLSVVFFIWFVALLASRLRVAEGERGRFARTASAGGIACAVFLGMQTVFGTAVASSLSFGKQFRRGALDPQLVRLLDGVGYSILTSRSSRLPCCSPRLRSSQGARPSSPGGSLGRVWSLPLPSFQRRLLRP